MFTSHDGKFLYVSRPSLADVVGIDLSDAARSPGGFKVDGNRSDHMAISPDGNQPARVGLDRPAWST